MYSQYYPGNVTAGDITAIVVDDPDTIFKVAVTAAAGSSTIASASSILLGSNMVSGTLTGSASTGNSSVAAVAAAAAAASTAGFRVLQLVPDTQIVTNAVYGSGTGTTTLNVTGLPASTVFPIGTDVFNVVNGQLQFTGSSLTAAATSSATGTAALTVVASSVTVAGTLALVQTPEVKVKLNFGVHRYNIA